jgi:acetyl-CoA acetyltransferase
MGKVGLLGAANRARKDKHVFEANGRYGAVAGTEGILGTGLMPGVFAQAGMEYAYEHDGVDFEQFAKVAEKNHAHSTLNPLAQYQKAFSLEEVMTAEMIGYPNTLLMCCPTGDGAAAAVLVSEERLRSLSKEQQRRAVKISASVMTSDPYVERGQVQPDVNTLTRMAADKAYEQSGVDPQDLDLVELHDCFATAELLHYDNLRLCEPGGAGKFIDERGPWRDGKIPVNVSGGLLSKGHPLGATGVANIFEVTTHLRGEAGDRQVPDAKVGLTHVIGLGSACAVHVLEKAAV